MAMKLFIILFDRGQILYMYDPNYDQHHICNNQNPEGEQLKEMHHFHHLVGQVPKETDLMPSLNDSMSILLPPGVN